MRVVFSFRTLLETMIDLATIGRAASHAIEVLNGQLQWQDLLDRPLYFCLHHVYGFLKLCPQLVSRPVPSNVLSELLLNVGLFPFLSEDLRLPWWSFMPASDASPSYGF